METEIKFINDKRENSAGFHMMIAQKWRKLGEPKLLHNPLIYSALEYRMSIERINFELYALMKSLNFISKDEAKKLEKLTNIITQIMEIIGNSKYLYRILKFNSMLFDDSVQSIKKLSIPDIKKLKNYWYALSDFCHMKINPEHSWLIQNFVKNGYELLNEVENYLWDIKVRKYFGFFRPETWQPEVVDLAEEYIYEKIDKDSVKTRLRLMKPIVASRFKR